MADSDNQAGPDRAHEDQKVGAVKASTLEAAPKDQMGPTGSSFHNPATVGSGTILADGTYGAPLPDPNVTRVQEDAAPKRTAGRGRRS